MTDASSAVRYLWGARATALVCWVAGLALSRRHFYADITDVAFTVLLASLPWLMLLIHSWWRPTSSLGLMRSVGAWGALAGIFILAPWSWFEGRQTTEGPARSAYIFWDRTTLALFALVMLALAAIGHLGHKRLALEARRRLSSSETLLGLFCVVLLALYLLSFDVARSYFYLWETRRVHALREIETCARYYATNHPELGFPPRLVDLPSKDTYGYAGGSSCRSAQRLADGEKHYKYRFAYVAGVPDSSGRITTFAISARPIAPRVGIDRSYFLDHSGILRATTNDRPASVTDSPAR